MEWIPITRPELQALLKTDFSENQIKIWQQIAIEPEKWMEDKFGNEQNGFWVVAKWKDKVIWYNDIEDGFNISEYTRYGKIDNYGAEQDELITCLDKLIKQFIK